MNELPTYQEAKQKVDAMRNYLDSQSPSVVFDMQTIAATLAAASFPDMTLRERAMFKLIKDLCVSHYNVLRLHPETEAKYRIKTDERSVDALRQSGE